MKTVYFVRHAKSSWANSNMSDHERPLNERGERDAPLMGQRLRHRESGPELVIASSAVRAKTTAKILAAEMKYPESEIIIDERLYGAEPNDALTILSELKNDVSCVMLVGHNPTFTELVNRLSANHIANMPTCSIAILAFAIDSWGNIAKSKGELLDFDYPKNPQD